MICKYCGHEHDQEFECALDCLTCQLSLERSERIRELKLSLDHIDELAERVAQGNTFREEGELESALELFKTEVSNL